MNTLRKLITFEQKKLLPYTLIKKYSSQSAVVSVSEAVDRKNFLFLQEQKRQLESIGRVEKISVEVITPLENVVMVMNSGISTPYDCAKHISKGLCMQSPLALINNEILWDMHRPLPGNCLIKFLNFKDADVYSLNHVFWRTGSFILGAVISRAFKEEIKVLLHSFPPPIVKTGSFVYDVKMNLSEWAPTPDELKILSAEFLSFVHKNLKIERLEVKKSVALEIFEGNPLKQEQIPEIAKQSKTNLITLYKVGDHIDISTGPMVGDTSFFGRCAVASVHNVSGKYLDLHRFQGVALPKGIMLNQAAFQVLMQRAQYLNRSCLPDFENVYVEPLLDIKPSLTEVPLKHL